MFVLILHPTEQFKIQSLQKEICTNMNNKNSELLKLPALPSDNSKIFPNFPLWFPLPEDFINFSDLFGKEWNQINEDSLISQNELKILLKEISKQIDSFNIDIFWSEEHLNSQIKLTISSKGKKFTSEIPFYIELNSLLTEDKKIIHKKISSSEIFPMSPKIFRIAKTVKLSENSQGLQAFVWKKLHYS